MTTRGITRQAPVAQVDDEMVPWDAPRFKVEHFNMVDMWRLRQRYVDVN